jgi:hypothetical protein
MVIYDVVGCLVTSTGDGVSERNSLKRVKASHILLTGELSVIEVYSRLENAC